MIVKLTAALVKRNTDSLLTKCKSGSIFIILRTRVCGNCVNRPTAASSFCVFPSVESTACSTSSAILNLKLAGKNLVSSPCCVMYPQSSPIFFCHLEQKGTQKELKLTTNPFTGRTLRISTRISTLRRGVARWGVLGCP